MIRVKYEMRIVFLCKKETMFLDNDGEYTCKTEEIQHKSWFKLNLLQLKGWFSAVDLYIGPFIQQFIGIFVCGFR